ncbi:Fatty acid synthase [Aphelenchoides bicaudatus]|nr:Fatty acid synthase [Aphelenchoides bicaudatus]
MSDSNNSVLLDFSPSKHPHLVDHVVSGDQPTLSAATLLCSVIENQHSNSQLHQITFLSTIELEEGKQLKLVENEDLLNVISNDGAIVLSAKTTKSIANLDVIEEELMSSLNFPLHSTDIDLILAEKFYPFMNNVGYRHKGDFQSVHWLELRIQNDKAYGTVVFNSSPNLDCQLDGLWQAIVYALLSTKSSSQRELLVPFCIRSLKSKFLRKLSTEWICSGRFVVNLRENYGNFMLFDGISNEVLMVGEEVIFLPKSTDEVESNETEDEQKLQQENGNKVDRMREDNATKMAADLQKIGIRSMSCRLPGNVKSPEDFWELLESARSTDQKIPAERISNRNELIRGQRYGNPIEGGNFLDEDVSLFDAALFRLSQNEANAADPQQRFALMCAYECLEKAGLIVDNGENLRNLGIFVGMMGTEYYCEDANTSNALMMLGASASIACGRISHFLDSRGISAVVDTACSSSLVALDMARSHLLDGRIDKALVIGVNLILSEKAMGQRANGKLLSVDGRCKSFDAQADGYGRADGCVAMLIERAQHDRQYEAFIESTNTNHDGKSAALTVPNGTSHVELIQRCMESVKDLEEKSIAFWEIHGTGTALGDPIEVNSLQKALSKYAENLNESVFLSTAKANIGHTEAASGLVGVLKSVLQLKHAQICPLPNFRSLNPQIQLSPNFKIPTRAVNLLSANKLCCGISSFGVGGTNACAILSKAEEINFKQQPTPTFKVLPISAKTKHSLQMMIEQINSLSFNQHMAPAFALHRRHYNHRTAFISQQNCFEQVTFEKEPIRLQILKVDQQPNKFWKTIPHCTDIYNKLSNNAHIDLVILLKFLKEVGVKRNIFYTDHSKAEAMLNFVYSNNFDDLLIKQHDNNSFGLFFNSSNNSVLINSVQVLEELIACLYISNSCEINWNFIYPASDENFLLEVVKTLPTYSFDNNICWKTSRQLSVFDHSILGNVIEKDDTRFKLENYLSKHRLPELFEKKYITIGFVIEGLASVSQYLRPSATVSVNKWQFNNQVFVRQMWVFTEVEFYNDEHQFCAEFCAELFLNNKSTNKKMKEKARQSATHSTEEDQNPDELAIKIAKLLQLSVINGLELSRNCYDVGFFDLGLDSLAMIGFANQMIEAQLPRLTTEELMTHSTVNKLTAYIRQKTGLLTKTNNPYDSGYSSVLNDDSSNERKNSDQQIDKTQLMYRILRNNEKVEERFKFRVAFNVKRNDISIFFRHGNKRSELTFNALSTRIAELKPNQIELSFKMPNELVDLNQTSVSKLFLKLGNALINSNQIIESSCKSDREFDN